MVSCGTVATVFGFSSLLHALAARKVRDNVAASRENAFICSPIKNSIKAIRADNVPACRADLPVTMRLTGHGYRFNGPSGMERQMAELNTVIRTFANEVEAHVAQAVLDANGIDSNLIRDDAGGMMPWLQWLHPIRLVVREVDSIEAVELLDSPPGPTLIP
jgi:hypothetical protein